MTKTRSSEILGGYINFFPEKGRSEILRSKCAVVNFS